jgi:hypothetical protein
VTICTSCDFKVLVFLDLSNDPLERNGGESRVSFSTGILWHFLFAFLVPANGSAVEETGYIIQWPFRSIINEWTKEEK